MATNLVFDENIPARFYRKAENAISNFKKTKWKLLDGLRGKFYSFRLNNCYRILLHPNDLAVVYHHQKYDREIANLKKRGL